MVMIVMIVVWVCDDDDSECECKCVSTNSRRRGLGQHRGRLKTTSSSFLIRFSVKWNKKSKIRYRWNMKQLLLQIWRKQDTVDHFRKHFKGEITVKDSDLYSFKKLFDTLKHAFATFCFKSERYINLNVGDKINYNVPRCADKLGSFSQTNSLNTACNVIY